MYSSAQWRCAPNWKLQSLKTIQFRCMDIWVHSWVFCSCCHVKHRWMLSSGYRTICTGKLLLNQPGKGSKGTFTCTPLSWAVQSRAAWLSTPAQAWMCVRKTSAYPLPITCFSLKVNQSRKMARDSQGAMLPLLEDVFASLLTGKLPPPAAHGELLSAGMLCGPQFNHRCYSPVLQKNTFKQ